MNNQLPNQNQEPTWVTILKIAYYGIKILDALTQKRWDSNVQRYRYRDGTFAPD
jgi:hypothetical protein